MAMSLRAARRSDRATPAGRSAADGGSRLKPTHAVLNMGVRAFAVAAGLALAALWSAAPAHAAAGFAFLEVPAGARTAALGGAYASLAEGPEAAFWNPAGLAATERLGVTGGHAELFEKLRHDYFSVAGPLFGGGVSGSIRALYSEPIDERDELGNLIGTFGAHDLEFGLGYGHRMGESLDVGASAQIVRERIANLAAQTWSLGVGAAWEPDWANGLRFAASGQNLGPAAHYTIDGVEGADVPLPAAFHAGVSRRVDLGAQLLLRAAVESRFTNGRSGIGMVGVEVIHVLGAALRAGLRVNDDTAGFGAGAGYRSGALEFDYAFVPMRLDLGDSHRFAFRTSF